MTQTLNKAETKQRNLSVDLIRIVAFCLVVFVHFFLKTDYYNIPFSSVKYGLLTFLRSVCMICVPLFITLTGYLMSNKRLNKRYYKGIVRTLVIFIIAEICCMIYDYFAFEKPFGEQIKSIGDAHYSWYIDMYIGLFLLIPFLNLAYNGLENKKQKQILLATTFAVCCAIPTVVGYFLMPQGFWKVAYPLAYYYAGCYIREYSPKISAWKCLALVLASNSILTLSLYLLYPNKVYPLSNHTEYPSAFVYVTAISIFCLLINSKQKLNDSKLAKSILPSLSRLTLGAYLISYITDDMVYDTLYAYVPNELTQFYYFPLTVLVSIIASLCLSYFINLICDGVLHIIKFKKA